MPNTRHFRWFSTLLLCIVCSSGYAADYSKIFKKVSPAVVAIYTTASQQYATENGIKATSNQGLGSGVLIDKEGHILTASHVVHLADKIRVQFPDGKDYPADVISTVPYADLALIKLTTLPDELSPARLGDSDKLEIGNELFLIGAPYGLNFSLSIGHFSGRRTSINPLTEKELEFLQTDAAVNKGNSGGPLFNQNGEVVGIISHIKSQSGGNEGLGFAASISMIQRLLLNSPSIWIGIEYIPLDGEFAAAMNVAADQGFLIQQVAKGSVGDALGLRGGTIPAIVMKEPVLLGGDVIIAVGGDTLYFTPEGMKRLTGYIDGVAKGDPLEFTVLRGGKELLLTTLKP
ncbi:MAG: trypsin-like peptidase domain-containing protein [Pseudomonadales bacterium]